MIQHESPELIGTGLSHELAERIAEWIAEKERRTQSWVAGVYAERGAGKTSVLLTLLERLERHNLASALALPTEEDKSGGRSRAVIGNLFKPAALRSTDELLFELLRHLQTRYSRSEDAREWFNKAREIEIERKDIERFLTYAEEVGTSHDDLHRRAVELHRRVATSTVELRAAFSEILSHLRCAGSETLVLLVDDIDLHPERALELLEIFHIFLDCPGVIVILAADRPLLLEGIEKGLKGRDLPSQRDLAAALLAKYVPYHWHIPILTEDQRFDELWPEGPDMSDRPELSRWWPSEDTYETYRGHFAPDDRPTVRLFAGNLLSPILPSTYRGLKAFHNRLVMVRPGFDNDDTDRGGHFLIVGGPIGETWRDILSLDQALLAPFLSAVIALDLQHPVLGLWNHIRMLPGDMAAALETLRPEDSSSTGQPDEDAAERRDKPDPFHETNLLLQRLELSARDSNRFASELRKQHLRHLARSLWVLQRATRRVGPQFDPEDSDATVGLGPKTRFFFVAPQQNLWVPEGSGRAPSEW